MSQPAQSKYEIVINDLRINGNVEEYEKELKECEAREQYEACAGIKKAIAEYTNSK